MNPMIKPLLILNLFDDMCRFCREGSTDRCRVSDFLEKE